MYISGGIAGLGLGSILGYRIIRDRNFTESEANIITLGGFAGALTFAGLVFLSGTDNPKAYWTGNIVGDIIGAITTASFIKAGSSDKHSHIHIHPESILCLGLSLKNEIPTKNQFFSIEF